jgi:hypothetical protein
MGPLRQDELARRFRLRYLDHEARDSTNKTHSAKEPRHLTQEFPNSLLKPKIT